MTATASEPLPTKGMVFGRGPTPSSPPPRKPDTATARQVADATREERRNALIELADLVDTEDRYCNIKPISPVLSRLVPALCSRKITDRQVALDLFSELVGAVAERRRFTSNERDFLLAAELPDTVATREAMHEHVESDVDLWADRLMGVAS